MAEALFRPIRGWRYDPTRAGALDALAAPPYDVIAQSDVERLLESSPHNVIRLELPSAVDANDPYGSASRAWNEWTSNGFLQRDETAHFYLVRHTFTLDGVRTGRFEIMGAVRLAQWEQGAVLPHEHTHEAAKQDRLMLMNALHANVSPILALYEDDDGAIRILLRAISSRPPDASFTDLAGDDYEVWHVTDPGEVGAIRLGVSGPLFVADGHHRYETALTYLDQRGDETSDGENAIRYIMAALTSIEDPGLVSLPYHRLIQGLPDDARARLMRQVETYFKAEEIAIDGLSDAEAAERYASAIKAQDLPMMALIEPPGDVLKLLRPLEPGIFEGLLTGESEAWERLGPCVFLDVLLTHGVGANQHEAETRGWLSYPRDAAEAIGAVREGGCDAGFLLQAVSMTDMTEAAEAGERLPPKSTYFFPKVATGIVLNSLAGRLED
ncbi:MAG: DUF1015 domain-containing protein [Chloroflexi bacterium]|nr:DUF1015 domain-containing protein [Chloroflexota bacterium]